MSKDKIQFFSKVKGLAEAFPIIPARQFDAKWMQNCKADYVKVKNSLQPSHLQLCPGIFDIFKYGYMVPLWHDTVLKTTRDREDFDWVLPSKTLSTMREGEAVGTHPYEVTKWLPKRHYSKHAIVKFNTPWNVIAPKGIKFLVLPIPYPDTFEFESNIGILDPAISTELNIQGYLNISEGEHMIKAGTPLMHIIPLSEKSFDFECRDMNDNDAEWLEKRVYFNIFGFKLNKAKLKDAYNNHFWRN